MPSLRPLTFTLAALALAGASPALAQEVHYDVRALPSLGGTGGGGSGIDNRGLITGFSWLPGNQTQHATLWRSGEVVDLGTLGGPNSGVLWPVKNDRGLIAGIAETDALNPLGEPWSCSAFFPSTTGHVCLGFIWERGHLRALPTLGGYDGFAAGVNGRGQVIGWAETPVHDPTCDPASHQVLQFKPVVWGPDAGAIQALPLVDGDSSGAATAINDRGQVVGISGTCDQAVGRFTAAHAVLWEGGRVTPLGDLGGVAWNTPMAINAHGDVVGFANVPGGRTPGSFHTHAFLWTRAAGIQDLGTLPGDTISQALGINAHGEVVGTSCGANGCSAVVWEGGVPRDLNGRRASAFLGHLDSANDVDDSGRITGQASDSSKATFAFVATPVTR